MTTQPRDPSAAIPITLQAQEWNAVLAVLMDAPYRVAAPLIQKITEQGLAHSSAPPPAKPNGAADHAPH
jgi:hypothetical protein